MKFSRRTLVLGLPAAALLASCSKFKRYDGPAVTSIVVWKGKRLMALMHGQRALATYKIALGGNPVGPKRFEGDLKTPEGQYYITHRNPDSTFHLSLGISYPNAEDRAFAASFGQKPGGDIFIHGRNGKKKPGSGRDWTAGCIAVKDSEIEKIYAMVKPGTPILILP